MERQSGNSHFSCLQVLDYDTMQLTYRFQCFVGASCLHVQSSPKRETYHLWTSLNMEAEISSEMPGPVYQSTSYHMPQKLYTSSVLLREHGISQLCQYLILQTLMA